MAIRAAAAGRVRAMDRIRASSIEACCWAWSCDATAADRRGNRAMPMATPTRPSGS
ncbi:hypothetical protein D9M72_633400 [compost metagenome]